MTTPEIPPISVRIIESTPTQIEDQETYTLWSTFQIPAGGDAQQLLPHAPNRLGYLIAARLGTSGTSATTWGWVANTKADAKAANTNGSFGPAFLMGLANTLPFVGPIQGCNEVWGANDPNSVGIVVFSVVSWYRGKRA